MQKRRAQRVTGLLADATGRSDEEFRLVVTVAAAAAGVLALLQVLNWLEDLGSNLGGSPRNRLTGKTPPVATTRPR